MAGNIYSKPILFTIAATIVILIGTIVSTFIPMFTPGMHPKLEGLEPYTPLQLAGRDVYQREGCVNCHTQTVRPLKAEVMLYGEYSKAGEFAYDHPFLWGSKRTGPDLARIGRKYPDAWHYRHFENPKSFYAKSNMPVYGWLKDNQIVPATMQKRMDVLDFPYKPEDIELLKDKNELDALVAYIQVIGTAVKKKTMAQKKAESDVEATNPFAGQAEAIAEGKSIYAANCSVCHGENALGAIGPSLIDDVWLNEKGDISDKAIYIIIANGIEEGSEIEGRKGVGGMPAFGSTLNKKKIWSLVAYIKAIRE